VKGVRLFSNLFVCEICKLSKGLRMFNGISRIALLNTALIVFNSLDTDAELKPAESLESLKLLAISRVTDSIPISPNLFTSLFQC
jgi:hypothetical protein